MPQRTSARVPAAAAASFVRERMVRRETEAMLGRASPWLRMFQNARKWCG
jgi:hypothetical protein